VRKVSITAALCMAVLCRGAMASAPTEALQRRIKQIEDAVAGVCAKADRGQLKEPMRVQFPSIGEQVPATDLRFAYDTLDRDMDAAVEQIDRLEKKLLALRKQESAQPERPLTFEERLRRAEAEAPAPAASRSAPAFDVFQSYEETVRDRRAMRDAQAEADMGRVAEERRQAEALQTARKEAEQKIQEQNRQWQEELDTQARKHAEAEEQWKREHSAGAFVKNAVRTVVGGAVTSFAGGFASSVGGGLADKVVRDNFSGFRPRGEYDREAHK